MYHDQGLAPFKALAGEFGVNFTAGLPWVRTSPDHGTAYDKAWKDMASEVSMREAIYKAIDIFRCRRNFLEGLGESAQENEVRRSRRRVRERKSGPENHGKEKKNSGENPVQEVRGKEAE